MRYEVNAVMSIVGLPFTDLLETVSKHLPVQPGNALTNWRHPDSEPGRLVLVSNVTPKGQLQPEKCSSGATREGP